MERYSMFLGRKNQYCDNDYTTKLNLQIQCDPYQITNGIFHRIWTKKNHNSYRNTRLQIAKAVLRKKNGAGGINLPDFRLYYKASHQDSMVLAQKQKYRPMEQDRKPRNKAMHLWVLIFYKRGKNIQWAKTTSSINCAGKTEKLHVKEWN